MCAKVGRDALPPVHGRRRDSLSVGSSFSYATAADYERRFRSQAAAAYVRPDNCYRTGLLDDERRLSAHPPTNATLNIRRSATLGSAAEVGEKNSCPSA